MVPRVGAFFDMDKTLIAENSGSVYMKARYERGEFDAWDLAMGLFAYLRPPSGRIVELVDRAVLPHFDAWWAAASARRM